MLKAAEFFVGGQQLVRLRKSDRRGVEGSRDQRHGDEYPSFPRRKSGSEYGKDIVESRLMTKSSVSRAVDSLVRQGYIHTREDDSDRRITHLVLEEKASPVIELGVQAQQEMLCFLCQGISEAELENFCRIHTRIRENAREAMKVYGTKNEKL